MNVGELKLRLVDLPDDTPVLVIDNEYGPTFAVEAEVLTMKQATRREGALVLMEAGDFTAVVIS